MFSRRVCRLLLLVPLTVVYGSRGQDGQAEASGAFVFQSLRIPMKEAGPNGLEGLLVRPNEPGRHPLALLTHGTPATASERAAMTPQRVLPLAMEFARRGWATVIVMRRGYGRSGGQYAESIVSCEYPDYMHPARESARDLRAAIIYLSGLPEIDAKRIIAVGGSGGGLAVTAVTVDPPPGLVAAISFAGGAGHIAPDTVCQPGSLLSTFWILGKNSRVPMLWVYAKNDHFFKSDLAEGLYREFNEAGGKATFIAAPPFGNEGHFLFTMLGIPIWTKYVEGFLKTGGLVLRAQLLPIPPVPRVRAPQGLSVSGQKGFQLYLTAPGEKAFAVGSGDRWGYEFGRRTLEEARTAALDYCKQRATDDCYIVMLNNVSVVSH